MLVLFHADLKAAVQSAYNPVYRQTKDSGDYADSLNDNLPGAREWQTKDTAKDSQRMLGVRRNAQDGYGNH